MAVYPTCTSSNSSSALVLPFCFPFLALPASHGDGLTAACGSGGISVTNTTGLTSIDGFRNLAAIGLLPTAEQHAVVVTGACGGALKRCRK